MGKKGQAGIMPIVNRIDELIKAKQARDKRKYTNEEIAYILDIATGTVRNWRKNYIENSNHDLLDKWCKFLDCEPGDILIRVPEKKQRTE